MGDPIIAAYILVAAAAIIFTIRRRMSLVKTVTFRLSSCRFRKLPTPSGQSLSARFTPDAQNGPIRGRLYLP